MHRKWAWATAALVVGLCGIARAAEGPLIANSPFNGSQNPAFRRWGGIPTERPKPRPSPTAAAAKAKANDTAAAMRAQEEANFLRRLAVCDRLRKLAFETGDETLEKQAEVLQQKAETVFKRRTADDGASLALGAEDKPQGGK